MKRLEKSTTPHALTINLGILLSMNRQWTNYAQKLMSLSSNDNQLQSRFDGAELVGSIVIVLESPRVKLRGRYGVITSTTEATISIALIPNEVISAFQLFDTSIDGFDRDRRFCITRQLRAQQSLGVMLPSPIKGTKAYEFKKVAVI
jgi:hypothetical protein